MQKVAIYCRLSDEDKNKTSFVDDSESIQNQKILLTKYAVDKEWAIYQIYSDDDYSGLDKDRPAFNQMLQDAEANKFNIVLCKHQSRFTRDMELVEKYLHNKFYEWGIRFISLTDNADTFEKGNKKSRQINGLVNEWYSEDISESIKATFRLKQENGKFIGSFASYGFEKDPGDKNKLIVDEEAAKVVKMIFSLYLEGYGTQHIAYMINESGILNPTKYKQSKGYKYVNSSQTDGHGLWNKTTVKRILKNQMYIGNMEQAKRKKINYKSKKIVSMPQNDWIVVQNTHEPIIDKEKFMQVQERLSNRVRSTGTGKAHMFATKVICSDCKSSMNKVSNKNYSYLRCKLYIVDPNKKLCSSHSIRLEQLTEIVAGRMKRYIESYSNDASMAQRLSVKSDREKKVEEIKTELKKIVKSIDENAIVLKNLYLDKVKGLISEDQFVIFNNNFISEKEVMAKRQKKLEENILRLEEKTDNKQRCIDMIKKYKNFTELSYEMVNDLIDYIEIGEKNKETREQNIIIHWFF